MLIKVLNIEKSSETWVIFEVKTPVYYERTYSEISLRDVVTSLEEFKKQEFNPFKEGCHTFLTGFSDWLALAESKLRKGEDLSKYPSFLYKTITATVAGTVNTLIIHTNSPCYLLNKDGQTIDQIN